MDRLSEKYSTIKFHENPSSGSRRHIDGRTDITKLTTAFRNFANMPKNGQNLQSFCERLSKVVSPDTWVKQFWTKPYRRCKHTFYLHHRIFILMCMTKAQEMDGTFQHCHASHTVPDLLWYLTQSYYLDDVPFTAYLHTACTNSVLQVAKANYMYGVA